MYSDELRERAVSMAIDLGNVSEAARMYDIPRRTLGYWVSQYNADDQYTIEHPEPDDGLSIEELVEHRKKRFEKKRSHAKSRKLIDVKVNIEGPFGILHFGDPHVDDDGTDIGLLERHTQLVRDTDGLFAANVGDTTNNWVGRLARLYGEQGTSAAEAWMLAEWFVNRCDWLYMIGGNHDLWSGSGDPLIWMTKRNKNTLYESSEVRLNLKMPGTDRQCIINARHDFRGHSQWNPTHGVMKAAQLGKPDDIMICGHKHVSGYQPLKFPGEDRVSHCIQVASYKLFDRYAKERGFRDQFISPGVVTVIDPDASFAGFITVFHDIEEGAEFLKWKRSRYKA